MEDGMVCGGWRMEKGGEWKRACLVGKYS